MNPGHILFHKNFLFHDGQTADKYLVILSDGANGRYLVVPTTTKPKGKGTISGCQSKDRYPNFFYHKVHAVYQKPHGLHWVIFMKMTKGLS
jgi:hypothetical protein